MDEGTLLLRRVIQIVEKCKLCCTNCSYNRGPDE